MLHRSHACAGCQSFAAASRPARIDRTSLREARVAISTLRAEIPEASPLVAEESALQAAGPDLRTEVLEAFPLLSVVSPGSFSRAAAELPTEAAPLLAPVVVASLTPNTPQRSVSFLSNIRPAAVIAASATLVFTVAVAPNESKKAHDEPARKSTDPKPEPMTLVISLSDQKINVYRGTPLRSKRSSPRRTSQTSGV